MAKQICSEDVSISVSSVRFNTTKLTLKSIDGTLLSSLDRSSKHFDKKQNAYSFDRDPELFRYILNAYRIREVHIPRNVCPMLFKRELQFWKIPSKMIAPCCWKYLYESESNMDDLRVIINEDKDYKMQMKANNQISPEQNGQFPKMAHKEKPLISKERNATKIWMFLEEPASSTAAKVWYYFYIFVVMVSVILYIIWLAPSLRVSRYLSPLIERSIDALTVNKTVYHTLITMYNERIVMAGGTDPHPAMFAVDVFCLIFFISETLVSMCVCPDKKKYFSDGYNLLKIFVCIGMSITFGLEFNKDVLRENVKVAHFMVACRAFNVLRLLLIFRLRKIYNSLHIMLLALRHSLKELLLLLFTFIVLVIIYGCLIFSAEIESDMFPNTQMSMWWAVITMTTIGYGDYYPVSSLGYVVGVVCAINGIIVLSLPIAAIAGTFGNLFARNSDFQKHKQTIKDQENDTFFEQVDVSNI
ncbi:potassium voltage-gated channel protein egl-36-like [Mercenaria mercenaria]|uniref:potassium voltage-gated channel protein egl-36-like n=1 Tax=Mercenaria mercenaria TaxID=6596 RepID=UPI00234F0529|nr:potassium voltage-gated channel protein egl-36-like [Mercenaria mercenaria]